MVEMRPVWFGDRDEFERADLSPFRVLPAQQGFGLANAAVFQVDNGLVIDLKLVLVDGAAQLVADGHAVLRGVLHAAFKIGKAVAAPFLRAVHGLIGVAQQFAGGAGVARKNRDADAGRDIRHLLAHHEGTGQVVAQLLRQVGDRTEVVQLGQGDGEFVAAQARHGVAAAHMALQAASHRFE